LAEDKRILAAARRHCASLFPLTPELWEAWLRDEAPALSPEELQSLLDAATKDYVSVDLWLFVLSLVAPGNDDEDEKDMEEVKFPLETSRDWMARALAAAGAHFSRVRFYADLSVCSKDVV
jgi:hypothetical protein